MLNRLFLRGPLPAAFVPTLAIEIAPPAVAGAAYLALTGGRLDLVTAGLAGYTLLMAVVQLRLLPSYRALRFGPGFWAFTFSYASVVTFALELLAATRPVGAPGYATALLVLITGFILAIAARTVALAVRGGLLPRGTT